MNRPGFSAYVYFTEQVLIGQASEFILQHAPASRPHFFEILPVIVDCFEFRIPVPPGFFAVAVQEIGKSRYQVSADVLDQNRYGIPFGADNFMKS